MSQQTSSQINLQSSNQPWWKHRWPWILMAGPFVAFVACGITIWLTFSAVDPQIKEGVVKRGLKITETESISVSKKQTGDSK